MMNNGFFLYNNMSQEDMIFRVDVNTLNGKNIILNFIAKIEYEVANYGYSNTANVISEHYDSLITDKISFLQLPVIQFILKEIEYKPIVKIYMYERYFNYIYEDVIKDLEYIYSNNDKIYKEVQNAINKKTPLKGFSSVDSAIFIDLLNNLEKNRKNA